MTERQFLVLVGLIERRLSRTNSRNFQSFTKSLVPLLGKISFRSGVFRTTAIFDDVVIKRQEYRTCTSNELEVRNILAFRKNKIAKKYFPHTHLLNSKFGKLVIQERIPYRADEVVYTPELKGYRISDMVEKLATTLDLNDCHTENFGFRKNGTLVIFDVHAAGSAEYDLGISTPDISGVCSPNFSKVKCINQKIGKKLLGIRPQIRKVIQRLLAA